jgi:adenylate kinase family enzyme
MNKKHIMLMGIQGSGKGTQAALINKNYGYISLETGAILRSVLENPSHKHYKEVSETVPHGKMTPDAVIFDLIKEFIENHPDNHILIDGAVRNIAQRKFFDAITTDYCRHPPHTHRRRSPPTSPGSQDGPVTKEIFGSDFEGRYKSWNRQ